MSKTTKKRFVTKQLGAEFVFPGDGERIARIIASRGRDLHEVVDENADEYLVSMPTKFRGTVWVKRGQFVYIQPIEEGDKVKAEIQNVLDTETVLYVREHGKWPEFFEEDAKKFSREAKRGLQNVQQNAIDPDMLPPSDSEGEYEDDDVDEEECEDEEDAEPEELPVFNPNRAAAPNWTVIVICC